MGEMWKALEDAQKDRDAMRALAVQAGKALAMVTYASPETWVAVKAALAALKAAKLEV